MVRAIRLDKKNAALVDDEDYSRCLVYKWYLAHDGYVRARSDNGNIVLSRFILNYNNRRQVHYRDGNQLNCQKKNIYVRVAKAERERRREEGNTPALRIARV